MGTGEGSDLLVEEGFADGAGDNAGGGGCRRRGGGVGHCDCVGVGAGSRLVRWLVIEGLVVVVVVVAGIVNSQCKHVRRSLGELGISYLGSD